MELHYSSSLIACVPSGDRAGKFRNNIYQYHHYYHQLDLVGVSPRKLILFDCVHNNILTELAFPSTIIKCQMNKDHIVVALDEQVFIYDIWSLALIKSLSCGKGGCISLCTGNLSYLAVPHHLTTGLIHIYNCGKDDIENLFSNGISAHKTKITHCQISTSGKYIATASTTGTIVRLFSLTSGDIVGSFRRGFHHALVTSISFCIKDEFVAVGSSSGTVHIFTINSLFIGNDSKSLESSLPESENKLNNQTDQVSSSSESKSVIPVSPVNFFQSALGTISNNVAVFASEVARQSKELRDAMDPVRAEYLIRIPGGESQFKTTILQEHYDSSTGSYPTIYIVTDGGFLYRYVISCKY